MTLKQQAVSALIEKFPNTGNRTLARILYQENKPLFAKLDDCYCAVRYARGALGKAKRKYQTFVGSQKTRDAFSEFPEGKVQLQDSSQLVIDGNSRALILQDIHIPYHHKPSLMAALDYGKDNDADLIILNGDTFDCFAVSFWDKDPRERNFKKEVELVREFLKALRSKFPKARIIFKPGNHEERYTRYMRVKAPELLGLEDFEMESFLKLSDHNIEYLQEKRIIKLGDLNVLHGHEYRFAISNPVNPARGLFLRCKAYSLCGHFHQSSHHTAKTVERKTIATWSVGCLCDLYPEYAPMNDWLHGFAFVEVSDGGHFQVHNKVIKDGKVY